MNLEYLLASPIILISLFAVIAAVIDPLFKSKSVNFWFAVTGLVLSGAAAVYTIGLLPWVEKDLKMMQLVSNNMILFGGYSAFFDIIFCLSGLFVLLASKEYFKREYGEFNEYYTVLLFAIIGMMLIAHANNLLILFIGVELMSIPFYILAGFIRIREKSVEAAIKYFLLGAFATGFLLYGIALVYGATASMDLSVIGIYLKSTPTISIYFIIGVGLIIIGLSFKAAAFPFHQWAPDVYHGSPTVVSAFLSSAGKAAALAAFITVANSLFPFSAISQKLVSNTHTVQLVIATISAITMLLANFSALVQKNVKRMLAYSSVAHAGYMLMGIAANNPEGKTGILFYASAYMLMQIGAFVIISVLERDDDKYMEISDYAGLSKAHPWLSVMMGIFMFSLAGIPPFAGFIGKYYLFIAAVKADFTWLTIIAVISSIISMYYYIGLVLQMYFKEPADKPLKAELGMSRITLVLTAAGTLLFGIFPSLIINVVYSLF